MSFLDIKCSLFVCDLGMGIRVAYKRSRSQVSYKLINPMKAQICVKT